MINYYDMEQLVCFYQCGTLSAAAEKLHISKSALTRCMQRIEADMGVSLFLRTKNSIALNETGKLAAEYAQKALEQADEMYQRVRDFDRSQHTILIGSCIPLPLPDLMNALAMHYPDATIGTETKENAILLDGLYHNTYSLIVLPYKPDDHELTAVHYCSETLMFYLPKNHKYAKRKALHFHEMDGENMLVYHNTGSWDKVIRSQMPNTHFIIQTEAYSLTEVIENSILPCFISNLSPVGQFSNRVAVPIRDDEARAEYYLVCKNSVKKRFDFLLKKR